MNKVSRLYNRYLKENLGLINLFGKVFGRCLFLLLTAFFAYKLSIEDFAAFAIFWSALRLLTFFTANNLYIIYFNKVRKHLLENKEWPSYISSNIIMNTVVLGIISWATAYIVFEDILISVLFFPILIASVLIRHLSEFAKCDNSLKLSIFIEDFLYYLLFFVFGIVSIFTHNGLTSIVLALLISVLLTAASCFYLFKKKFGINTSSYLIKTTDFSFSYFRLGINYTILRGNEMLSNFAVRYLGKIYFGDLFVAYAHIMYQFYNIFTLLTMAVISGLQSKITVKDVMEFSKDFVQTTYLNIIKTIAPFVLGGIMVIAIFNTEILTLFFSKYVAYDTLLVKVAFVGLVFMLIQPLVFILIYNNQVSRIKTLNFAQYLIVFTVYLTPLFYKNLDEQIWLLTIMVTFILIQGAYALIKYNRMI